MLHTGQALAQGRPVAAQLLRDDPPGHVRHAREQLPEERLRRLLIPPARPQDLEPVAVLIDGAPQAMALTVNRQQDRIQVPRVPRSGALPPALIGVLGLNLAKTKILAKYNTVSLVDRLHGGTKPAHAAQE
jgi:hypothetical protein